MPWNLQKQKSRKKAATQVNAFREGKTEKCVLWALKGRRVFTVVSIRHRHTEEGNAEKENEREKRLDGYARSSDGVIHC